MINKGAFARYSHQEMLLHAVPRELRATAVTKLELDPRDPSMFKYLKLQNHALSKCITADALALLYWHGACTAPAFSPYSIPAGVPLPQIAVLVMLLAITCEATPVPHKPRRKVLSLKPNVQWTLKWTI